MLWYFIVAMNIVILVSPTILETGIINSKGFPEPLGTLVGNCTSTLYICK